MVPSYVEQYSLKELLDRCSFRQSVDRLPRDMFEVGKRCVGGNA